MKKKWEICREIPIIVVPLLYMGMIPENRFPCCLRHIGRLSLDLLHYTQRYHISCYSCSQSGSVQTERRAFHSYGNVVPRELQLPRKTSMNRMGSGSLPTRKIKRELKMTFVKEKHNKVTNLQLNCTD